MTDVFFSERVKEDIYGMVKSTEPPFLHDLIKELLTPIIKEKVEQYINDNSDAVKDTIKGMLSKGMAPLLMQSINSIFSLDLLTLNNNMISTVDKLRHP